MMRFTLVWLGVGALIQFSAWMYARKKYGRYAADHAVVTTLGRFAVLKLLVSCVIWPFALWALFQSNDFVLRRLRRETWLHNQHMRGRCPDCGEMVNGHTHDERPLQ